MYEWVNVMHNLCKALWIKALYKCTVYHNMGSLGGKRCVHFKIYLFEKVIILVFCNNGIVVFCIPEIREIYFLLSC